MAQLVVHGTLDFCSGHDLGLVRLSPITPTLGLEPALDTLALPKKSIFTTVVD